jgi:hypothetical protein
LIFCRIYLKQKEHSHFGAQFQINRDCDVRQVSPFAEPGERMTVSLLRQEIAQEQGYVTMLYEVLDRARDRAAAELRRVHGGPTTGTDQAATERDSFAGTYAGRLNQLMAMERGLCFGRIDAKDEMRFYISRIGLFDDDHNPLLIDWRAPVAQPFYRATSVDPMGVLRRRHIRLIGRSVVAVDDDIFDLAALDDDHNRSSLIGEAALFASLSADRTGRMSEIVATIQAEQDAIIRAGLPGVLVVQGGPGTGKTVVALHRAAYLLYTHRDQLARRGVLVVGPNATFLRYIEQVLPSLGETEVVLSTIGDLLPGVVATAAESPEASRRRAGGEPDQGQPPNGRGDRPRRLGSAPRPGQARRHTRAPAHPALVVAGAAYRRRAGTLRDRARRVVPQAGRPLEPGRRGAAR